MSIYEEINYDEMSYSKEDVDKLLKYKDGNFEYEDKKELILALEISNFLGLKEVQCDIINDITNNITVDELVELLGLTKLSEDELEELKKTDLHCS